MKIKEVIYKLVLEKTDNGLIQFFRYGFVGGASFVVNYIILFLLTNFLGMNYLISNIIGYILGLITNYILSKVFVFTKDYNISRIFEFTSYAVIGTIGFLLDTLLLWVGTDLFNIHYLISKLISTALVFIWNFSARKVLYILVERRKK